MKKLPHPVPTIMSKRLGAWLLRPVSQSVSAFMRAIPNLRKLSMRLEVAKWHYLAVAVARGTKVGAILHSFLRILSSYVRPYARTHLGEWVHRTLFDLGMKLYFFTFRFSKLHSKFLRLEFEAVQRLKLGERRV